MFNRMLGIAIAVIVSSFFVSCEADNTGSRTASAKKSAIISKDDKNKVLSPVAFKVPASVVINAEKAEQFVKTSSALMILGEKWSEQIEKASDQERVEVLKNYEQAREQVCLRMGLAGMAEFKWIDSVALKAPENAAVLKNAGIQVP